MVNRNEELEKSQYHIRRGSEMRPMKSLEPSEITLKQEENDPQLLKEYQQINKLAKIQQARKKNLKLFRPQTGQLVRRKKKVTNSSMDFSKFTPTASQVEFEDV